MVQPINYMAAMPYQDLSQQFTGLAEALEMREQRATKEREQQRTDQIRAQYAADLQAYQANPTASAAAAMVEKYPGQREAFGDAWKIRSQESKDQEFGLGVQAYSALMSGQPEVASRLLDEQIAATKNAGKDTAKLEALKSGIGSNPTQAAAHIGLILSSVEPEKWGKVAGELRSAQKAPAELSEAQARAHKAAVDAKFAESNAVTDLQKKGWDITKIQEDIKIAKENSRIAAMNAAISREGNQLKKVELATKMQEAKDKRDEAVRAKTSEVESARGNMDNMLNTADRILKTPMGVVGAAAGPVDSRMLTIQPDVADFEALVETLGSQSFIAQIPNIKGMGALSNAEGEKLQAALQNFSLKQSPERLLENVKEAQRLILKGRANLTKRYGVPEVIPDTPAAAPSANEVDALLKKYGAQ